ncbi:hypothetical protein [Halomonas sp. KO116]|uniref:hypothetical protein n=1 Tax=Halomonas sp. KO116 TaxID=1504981 RepID=UPI0004E43110|nr:hypothetical protein [Halomonas sp. KO116]AJY50071.1 hypothetical protein KO116_01586 [Halomonas sp. KO116]
MINQYLASCLKNRERSPSEIIESDSLSLMFTSEVNDIDIKQVELAQQVLKKRSDYNDQSNNANIDYVRLQKK